MQETALLVMDFQKDIVEMLAGGGSREALAQAVRAADAARAARIPVVFVTVAYRHGHQDASLRNKRVAMLRNKGILLEGTPGADLMPDLARAPHEPVVTKRRVGAFSHTDMAPLLSALDVRKLVLCGIATSGVVLTTVRQAADADFGITVLADASADSDAEVHKVLTGKVFPAQADVLTTDAWIASLK